MTADGCGEREVLKRQFGKCITDAQIEKENFIKNLIKCNRIFCICEWKELNKVHREYLHGNMKINLIRKLIKHTYEFIHI